eukprot:scaffold24253_cov65-Phaeocystis_antarctica.AAC.2
MASDLKNSLRQSPLLNLLHPLRVNTATRAATDPNAATDLLLLCGSHHPSVARLLQRGLYSVNITYLWRAEQQLRRRSEQEDQQQQRYV